MTEKNTEQRADRRVRGPFEAVRAGLLEFKQRLYDLSAGGCLIDSMAVATIERVTQLRIDLPDSGSVTVCGQIILPTRDIGYAVRFIDVDARTRETIERALKLHPPTHSR